MVAIGKAGSYANIQPVNDPLAGAITFADDVFARKRKEDADKAEKERVAAEKKRLEDEKDLELQGTFSGFGTPDAAMASGLRSGVEVIAQAQRDLDSGKISREDYIIKKQNVKTGLDYLKKKQENINAQAGKIATDISEGNVFEPAIQEALSFGGALDKGNFQIKFNPKDGTLSHTVFEKNEETGETRILEKGNVLNFGSEGFSPIRKFNFDDDLKSFKTNNPIQSVDVLGSSTIETRTKAAEQTKENIKSHVQGLLNNKDVLTQAYYLSGGQLERNIIDPVKIKQAEDYLVSKYEKAYVPDTAVKVDVQRQRLAMDKQKADEDKIKTSTFKFDNVRTDDFLSDKTPGKKVYPTTVYTTGISFSKPVKLGNLGGQNSDLNAVEVLGFTKDKKSGDIVVTGKALKTKNAKFKVGGETLSWDMTVEKAAEGNQEAKAALDSYSIANNYGNFTRRVTNEDEANAILMQAGYDVKSANEELERLNPDAKKETAPKSQEEFNAKWAKLKSGESLLAPDGNTYTKK